MALIPNRKKVHEGTRRRWQEKKLRTRLAAARRYREVRQQDLADAVGVSVATLREIEAGRVGAGVSVGVLLRCAAALDLPLSALIEDEWLAAAEQVKPARARMPTASDQMLSPPPP